MSEYSEALEWCDEAVLVEEEPLKLSKRNLGYGHRATIKRALRIAEALEKGVSTETTRVGFEVLEENYDGINGSHMGIRGLSRAFECMAQQLIKECNDG